MYNIQRQGTVYLIFEAVSKGAREIYIDDINVYLAPSCRPVKGVDVGLPTTSSIDIKWQQGDKEKQWVVNYELTNKDDGSVVSEKDTVVPTIPFTIKNMSPATKYGLTGSVAALCSIGDTSEYKSFKMDFMTECLPVSDYPFVESFEGSEFPHRCWTKHKTVNASANADWKLNLIRDYSNRGSYSARMDVRFQNGGKHDHIVLTLPQFDIPADGDYRFAFYMYRGVILKSAGRVRVWSSSISVLDTLTATKLLDISSDNQASPESAPKVSTITKQNYLVLVCNTFSSKVSMAIRHSILMML